MWHYNYGPYLEHSHKYIKRYRVDGKWRYVYATKADHNLYSKIQTSIKVDNEGAERNRKYAQEEYERYDRKRNAGFIRNHKESIKPYIVSKRFEREYRESAEAQEKYLKYLLEDEDVKNILKNNLSSVIDTGKKLIEKLKKKKK